MGNDNFILYKIILVGDNAVGKTSLINQYVEGKFEPIYMMTLGAEFYTKIVETDDFAIKLLIFDIASQDFFAIMRESYFKGAAAAIIVFDLTRYDTFSKGIWYWLGEIMKYVGDIPTIIIGNKVDLFQERVVWEEEIKELSKKNSIEYFITSAKTGEKVLEAFNKLARMLYEIDKNSSRINHRKDLIEYHERNTRNKKQVLSKKEIFLINKNAEKLMVSRYLEIDGFRILVSGNVNLQQDFLINLFKAEKLNWPPDGLEYLYGIHTQIYKFIEKNYKFQYFFLANLEKMLKNKKLLNDTCQNAHGLLIFLNYKDEIERKNIIEVTKFLKERVPNLKISLICDNFPKTNNKNKKILESINENVTFVSSKYQNAIIKILSSLLNSRDKDIIITELNSVQKDSVKELVKMATEREDLTEKLIKFINRIKTAKIKNQISVKEIRKHLKIPKDTFNEILIDFCAENPWAISDDGKEIYYISKSQKEKFIRMANLKQKKGGGFSFAYHGLEVKNQWKKIEFELTCSNCKNRNNFRLHKNFPQNGLIFCEKCNSTLIVPNFKTYVLE